jgi:hypothetical protein
MKLLEKSQLLERMSKDSKLVIEFVRTTLNFVVIVSTVVAVKHSSVKTSTLMA